MGANLEKEDIKIIIEFTNKIKGLLEARNQNEKYLENFDKFCVWAFCFKCKHQFPKGVIQSWLSFLVSKKFGAADSMFAPLNAQSAADFKGLEKGHCSKCNSNDLIVIINDLPDD